MAIAAIMVVGIITGVMAIMAITAITGSIYLRTFISNMIKVLLILAPIWVFLL